MTLSEISWNAIMSMVTLATHQGEQALRLKDLQAHLQLSRPYTEQLMAKLRKAGLVEGIRGTGGGYYLTKPLQRISLAELVMAVEEPSKNMSWLQEQNHEAHLQRHIWQELDGKLHALLAGISLADLVKNEAPQTTFQPSRTTNMIAGMFPVHRPAANHSMNNGVAAY